MTTIATVRAFLKKNQFSGTELSNEGKKTKMMFVEAMDNDFNVSEAWNAIYALAAHLNKMIMMNPSPEIWADFQLFLELLDVMGINSSQPIIKTQLIEDMIDYRNKLRSAKKFDAADDIRMILGKNRIILEDKSF